MKLKLCMILLFCLLAVAPASATVLSLDNGETETTIKWGTMVTLTWDYTDTPELLYFRIRRAPSISGTYAVWVTIPKDQRTYTFKLDKEYQYFITAWYTVTKADGTTVVQETVGSNHVRIKVK